MLADRGTANVRANVHSEHTFRNAGSSGRVDAAIRLGQGAVGLAKVVGEEVKRDGVHVILKLL